VRVWQKPSQDKLLKLFRFYDYARVARVMYTYMYARARVYELEHDKTLATLA